MKDPDDNFDQAFDEDTEVSKIDPSPRSEVAKGPATAAAAAAIGGLAATSESQIFEAMPQVDQSLSRSPAKPLDDWAESSEFDALGEGDHSESDEHQGDEADDQDFDAETGVVSKSPDAPRPAPTPPVARATSPVMTPEPVSPPPEEVHSQGSGPSAVPLEFEGAMAFEESVPHEIPDSDDLGTQRYMKAPPAEDDDEFTVEVEVAKKRAAARAAAPAPVQAQAPAREPEPEPEPEPEQTDEELGAELAALWAGCEPLRDLPSKQQRVAFAAAAVTIQEILRPHEQEKDAKSLLVAKLKKQIDAQAGLISYTPDWRACDKELGTLLPKLEKLVTLSNKEIAAKRFRNLYLNKSFRQSTCVDILEQEARSADLSLAWWERISSLAVAASTRRHTDGSRAMLPAAEVAKLWNGKLPAQKVQTSTIVAAVRFFQESMGKVDELKMTRDLFDKGLALEVIGYQIALREDVFHPTILFACAEYHTKLYNYLQLPEHRKVLGALDESFTSAYKKAGKIFGL